MPTRHERYRQSEERAEWWLKEFQRRRHLSKEEWAHTHTKLWEARNEATEIATGIMEDASVPPEETPWQTIHLVDGHWQLKLGYAFAEGVKESIWLARKTKGEVLIHTGQGPMVAGPHSTPLEVATSFKDTSGVDLLREFS